MHRFQDGLRKAFLAFRISAIAVAIALSATSRSFGVLSASLSDTSAAQKSLPTEAQSWEELPKQANEPSLSSALLDLIYAYRRKALRSEDRRWPKAVVPYYISSSVDNINSSARQVIKDAMGHWENETCIRFVPADVLKDKDFINFQKGDWCNSVVGRVGGRQSINLAYECLKVGSVIHELGHAIGWVHEHKRPDRDNYIQIIWEKVKPAEASNYANTTDTYINTFGVPYDYGSIMHYSASSIIKALDLEKQKLLGQRVKLSFYDAKLANIMYKCAEKNQCDLTKVKCTGEGYVGPKCTCVCPDGTNKCSEAKAPTKKPFPGVPK